MQYKEYEQTWKEGNTEDHSSRSAGSEAGRLLAVVASVLLTKSDL